MLQIRYKYIQMFFTLFEFSSVVCASFTIFVSVIKNDCTNPVLIACLFLLYFHQWITMKQKKIMRWYYLRNISAPKMQHEPPMRMRSRKKIQYPDQNNNFIHFRTSSCPSSIDSFKDIDNQAIDVDQSKFVQHE